jgi:membrane associated rhomboid family serine protease
MGFYDREYARDQRAFAWELSQLGLSKTLVIVHAGVYLVQLVTADRAGAGAVTEFLMLDIADLRQGQVWRLLTAMFIHDPHNWLNLVWNLVLLWFFGPLVESLYGQRRFLFFYLLAGLVGNLAWWLVNLWHPHPPALFGAAPAITAVLVLCTFHYPRQTVLLFFVLPVPLWLITLLYVGKDVVGFLQQLGGLGRPGLAAVHVAGLCLPWFITSGRSRAGVWSSASGLPEPALSLPRKQRHPPQWTNAWKLRWMPSSTNSAAREKMPSRPGSGKSCTVPVRLTASAGNGKTV